MASDNLNFSFENGTLRISIIGEIEHKSAVKIREEIDEKIYESSPEKVVLDLLQLDFMDSSGLGLIIGRIRIAQEIQAELVIENPNKSVLHILKISGVNRIVKINPPKKG